MNTDKTFIGQEASLSVFNGQAIINLPFEFVFDDCATSDYDFPGFSSAYLKVYNERGGSLVIDLSTRMTRSGKYLVLNASVADMTFEDYGKYEYEMGYILSGGYSIVLRYGEFIVL